jgi:DNA-binding SARP family transcriptional activator
MRQKVDMPMRGVSMVKCADGLGGPRARTEVARMLRLLGSVEVWAGPGRLVVGSPRQQLLLAALAVDAGRTVPLDVLVDRMWGTEPPPQVRRTVHSYIARTRRLVEQLPAGADGPIRLAHTAGGYRLDIHPERVDLHRFRRLVDRARSATAVAQRGAALREAVALWRGDALIGLDGQWAQRVRRSWQHERVSAVVAWAEAELAAGDPSAVEGPVTELAAEFPLDEPLAGVLMRVFAAFGFKARALEAYAATRARLADELGVDAGPDLQEVHRALVRGELDPALPAVSAVTARSDRRAFATLPPSAAFPAFRGSPAEPPPAQLPPDLISFAGRDAQLAVLAAVAEQAASPSTGGVVAVLSGPAGIGKTALALYAAHRAAARFPDGQLYLDLHGTDPDARSFESAAPVRHLLDGLNVPAGRIPASPEVQTALPQPYGRPAPADRPRQRPRRRPGAAAAARLPRLPGAGHQP